MGTRRGEDAAGGGTDGHRLRRREAGSRAPKPRGQALTDPSADRDGCTVPAARCIARLTGLHHNSAVAARVDDHSASMEQVDLWGTDRRRCESEAPRTDGLHPAASKQRKPDREPGALHDPSSHGLMQHMCVEEKVATSRGSAPSACAAAHRPCHDPRWYIEGSADVAFAPSGVGAYSHSCGAALLAQLLCLDNSRSQCSRALHHDMRTYGSPLLRMVAAD